MSSSSPAVAVTEATISGIASHEQFWIFGYGSLIWKPPPHFDRRVPGYVQGYVRRFWQASEDHRGTPEAPGRVLTLIERSYWETLNDVYTIPEDKVWGVAYRIEATKVEEVKEYLDIREINGYSIQYTDFHPVNAEIAVIRCLVYIGMPDNPQFLGVQEPQALAEHIVRSKGPSGENREYLFMLDIALRDLSHKSGDRHIQDLASRVHNILGTSSEAAAAASACEIHRVTSKTWKSKDHEKETDNTTAD